MLKVTMLGGASFAVDGAVVRSDIGPAGRLLACYLFEFSGRPHRRERLVDLFWSDLEVGKARAALNTALWRIRKLLDIGFEGGGRSLITVGNQVILEPAAFLQVDTHALQTLSRRISGDVREQQLSEAEEEQLGAVVESYAGPFLDGEDDDWILQERERLHSLFVSGTLELMRSSARRGQNERALEYGRRILTTDPLRESVQRDMMLLLVMNGQRANAIRAYRSLKTMLRSDLDIDPMPDTERLYQEIVSGAIFDRLGGPKPNQLELRLD